ncbi:hypothetical protein NBRC10512_007207 [Rhodotorula toruloides]|uniref:RHTO0S20e00980g1_1 n=2 Tax=Rhodotorula toruloides TaxID=5286 RepID=A0A061BLC1_RHOTO|nr:uncharacterized protein RHTO_04288 [Rhodotorula toruloides NP11]EMS19514.1 hypothetical protein RHTO_04288 [Rhodotorula toruloides NP11]CDR48768.1 RHTO0S20e00980g1_1 [Rhodotorula toruloides]
MTSYITKKVGRRLAGQNLAQYEPADPHYETYTDAKGRQKKRKRAIPAGLSKRDERILRSVRRRAHYLDKGFSLCGFRFGWTAILGLIPGAGDIAQFILGYSLVLRKCREAELPATLAQRMLFNQLVGLGIGLIPLVGDITMAVWKANSRNAALLEEFLLRRAQSSSSSTSATSGAHQLTAAEEEELANQALVAGRIDKRTGEPTASTADLVGAGGTGAVGGEGEGARAAAEASRASGTGAGGGQGGGRKFYGWGKGAEPAAETAAVKR